MWDKDPVSFIDDVVLKDGSKLIKDISTDMLNGVVNLSPIDTSRYISNHIVSFNSPDYGFDEGKKLGRAGSRAEGMAKISGISDKEMPTVFIQTNVPYSKYLEWGRSNQAPNGVYRITFEAVSMWYR